MLIAQAMVLLMEMLQPTPTIRLKEDVKTIDNALDKVSKLRGVEYTRKETKAREIGVIAQEVKEIVPELVTIENKIRY